MCDASCQKCWRNCCRSKSNQEFQFFSQINCTPGEMKTARFKSFIAPNYHFVASPPCTAAKQRKNGVHSDAPDQVITIKKRSVPRPTQEFMENGSGGLSVWCSGRQTAVMHEWSANRWINLFNVPGKLPFIKFHVEHRVHSRTATTKTGLPFLRLHWWQPGHKLIKG